MRHSLVLPKGFICTLKNIQSFAKKSFSGKCFMAFPFLKHVGGHILYFYIKTAVPNCGLNIKAVVIINNQFWHHMLKPRNWLHVYW